MSIAAITGTACAPAPEAPPAPEIPEIVVGGLDYGFAMPTSFPAGPVRIAFTVQ